jgi:hypothetical protein
LSHFKQETALAAIICKLLLRLATPAPSFHLRATSRHIHKSHLSRLLHISMLRLLYSSAYTTVKFFVMSRQAVHLRTGYLETDSRKTYDPTNGSPSYLGVPNWFMWRPPRPSTLANGKGSLRAHHRSLGVIQDSDIGLLNKSLICYPGHNKAAGSVTSLHILTLRDLVDILHKSDSLNYFYYITRLGG